MKKTSTEKIRLDGGTQPRETLISDTIAEYADSMTRGENFPPVVVFHDGSDYWLADGFHRVRAARRAGIDIEIDVKQGSQRDAVLYSVGANSDHGLPRTNSDKRRAVETLLRDPEWAKWSNREIAKRARVSSRLVDGMRVAVSANDAQIDSPRTCTRNGTTYEVETGNIGGARIPPSTPKTPHTEAELAPVIALPHVSNNSGNNEWYTPEQYIDAARRVMGGIDLDPASSASANNIVKADRFYTEEDDGLDADWTGRVWLNPPYSGDLIGRFADKLASEINNGLVSDAIVLVNNATETKWFHTLAELAVSVCFPVGRIRYLSPDTLQPAKTPLQGQCFLYHGDSPTSFHAEFGRFGIICAVCS